MSANQDPTRIRRDAGMPARPAAPATPPDTAALTWAEIVDHCSRLHTTRTRPEGPWPNAELREDSQSLEVIIGDRPARIVPTRMHEPGFYYWYGPTPCRDDKSLDYLKQMADAGEVRRAD